MSSSRAECVENAEGAEEGGEDGSQLEHGKEGDAFDMKPSCLAGQSLSPTHQHTKRDNGLINFAIFSISILDSFFPFLLILVGNFSGKRLVCVERVVHGHAHKHSHLMADAHR